MNDVAVVTIVAKNYAAYALALTASLTAENRAAKLYIVVIDALARDEVQELEATASAQIILPLDLLTRNFFLGLAYSYNVTELSTALKPFVLRHLLDLGHRRVIYLDPDIIVMRSLKGEVLTPLNSASIVLTPHTTEPIPLDGHIPSEITLLIHGAYNLGFIGVRDCQESRTFLSWWAERLERFCLEDREHGLFVDQKWIDLVPGLFPATKILHHRGLNVAYWNLHSRQIVSGHRGLMLDTGEPLIFFHFSGFDSGNPQALSPRREDRIDVAASPTLRALLETYALTLERFGHERHRSATYGYARLSDGTRVDRFVRKLCRDARELGVTFPDPHDVRAKPSLLDYCNASESGTPGDFPRLTRYFARVHASRPELQAAFPDPSGINRMDYLTWVRSDAHRWDSAFIEATMQPPI